MSKNELIQKIQNAYEMVIRIADRRFTICDENEKGFSIAEWDKPETEKYFIDAEALVEGFVIDGVNLLALIDRIVIDDYTGFVE